jgi:peptidyl-prolyl cis-trans isomerase D
MLNLFRRGPTSKIMLGVLALGLFAIVITGFGTGGSGVGGLGGGGDALATVDGEAVTAAEVTDQVNRQLQNARQQQPDLDIGTFFASGAFEGILDQMIQSKALEQFGRDQGLTASKRMVDGEIASITAFHNLAGQFDDATFRMALQQQRLTEKQVRDDIESTLIRQQLLLPAGGSPKVPQAMALQYASLLLEQRTGSVGVVPAAAMGTGAEPNAGEVAAFYKANEPRYTIPERRVLRYAMFGTEQVAGAAQPTDAEIQAAYAAQSDKYGAKESRTLSQVVLPDQAAARAFAAKIAGGASFAQAAQQAGFSPADTSIGAQTRQQFAGLTSAPVAQAAFSAAAGATTQPIQSPLGWHIVRVDAINNVPATPLAAVRAELQQQVAKQKGEQALADLAARIEDKLAEGSSFEEIAKAEKLTIQQTPPVTAAGRSMTPEAPLGPEVGPLIKAGFEMAADEDPVVETVIPGQRFAIVAVGQVLPPAPPPLAQIQDQVKGDLIAQRAADRAKAVATAIVAKINGGMPVAQAFAEAKLPLPPVQPVSARRMDIARPGQPVPPPLAMLFSMPKGKARVLRAPNGEGWFVVHLAEAVPGNAGGAPGLIQATRGQFEQIMGEEYATQFSRAVATELKVKRNADAIRATKQGLQRGGATAQ